MQPQMNTDKHGLKTKPFIAALFLSVLSSQSCFSQVITTVAGNPFVFRGDGGPAANAPLGAVAGVAIDSAGNLYASDVGNRLVVKISTTGILTVVAGNGIRGFSGDGGRATSASLSGARGVAVDTAGNLYIADSLNQRVRKIDSNGVITTVAGNGVTGFSGDGGRATSASLNLPSGVAVDAAGNLYIADSGNNRIRKVTAAGIISTAAGNGVRGFSGDAGAATSASLAGPSGVASDAAGNLYIADTNNHRIRKVSASGTITTIAGDGFNQFGIGRFFGDGGPATSASLNFPSGVTLDAGGNLYIADTTNQRLRKVNTAGVINTVAGNGTKDFSGDGGPAASASLSEPSGVVVDVGSNLYIADSGNNRVRQVSAAGTIGTLAGNGNFGFSGDGGAATGASLFSPSGVAVDATGNLYIADTGNQRLRKVGAGGIITSVAGNGVKSFSGDGGPAAAASLAGPTGVAVDVAGNLYIADSLNTRVRKVGGNGFISTVAGNGTQGFSGDGGAGAALNNPSAVAVDAAGNLYIGDTGNQRVRKVNPGGTISTVAGNGTFGFSGDAGPATAAQLAGPSGVAADIAGNLYIADTSNQRIRKVSAGGTITTLAGNGVRGFSGDGGQASNASLNLPTGVAVDSAGNLYLTDSLNFRVRKVSPGGMITTVAGNGQEGFSGDGGPATSASLAGLSGIAVDSLGNILLSDNKNHRVRRVLTSAPPVSVAPASLSFSAPAGAPAVAAQPIALSSPVTGLGWSASTSTQSGGGWLSVSPAAGATPGLIAASVSVANLAPGTYQGTITIQVPLGTPATQSVAVTLTVEAAPTPKLTVAPGSLAFEIPAGAGNPPARTIQISNAGSGALNWTARAETTAGGNWLEVSPTSGSASATSPATVRVSAVVGSLQAGVYTGSVVAESAAPSQVERVTVTLLVSQVKQSILVSQSGLLFTGVEGGAVVPSQTFGILNAGEGVMSWTAEATALSGGNWLTVAPTSGRSDAASLEVPLVEVGVNVSGLRAGPYSGLVRINAPGASNSPQFMTVTLNVLPPGSHPGVVVRPTNLIFAAQTGTFSPGSQTVRLSTSASGRIEARSGLFTLEGGDWLEILPPNLVLSAADSRTIVVQPTLGSLSPGVYRGQLALQFSDLDNPSQAVPAQALQILFLVAPAPAAAISLTPTFIGSERSTGLDAAAALAACAPQRLIAVNRTLNANFTSPVGWPTSIELQVVDDCGSAIGSATVVASFSNGDPPLALASLRNGAYTGTWRPVTTAAQVTVTVRATLPPLNEAMVQAQGQVQANPTAPALFAGGIVNGASFARGEALAPGSIVSVFGRNLASGQNFASRLPLDVTLGGATLNVGGVDVPLFFSSDGQINAQLPFELTPNSRPHAVVRVRRDALEAITVPETITIAAARPGIFTVNQQGTGQGAILDLQGRLVDSTAPAAVGDVVQVFSTGLGATQPAVRSGQAAPGVEPLARVVVPVEARVGGRTARVLFAGLAPGFVGLYQVNVEIPEGTPANPAVPLTLLQSGVSSNTVSLALR